MLPKTHYKLLRQWEFRAQMSLTCDVCLVDKEVTPETPIWADCLCPPGKRFHWVLATLSSFLSFKPPTLPWFWVAGLIFLSSSLPRAHFQGWTGVRTMGVASRSAPAGWTGLYAAVWLDPYRRMAGAAEVGLFWRDETLGDPGSSFAMKRNSAETHLATCLWESQRKTGCTQGMSAPQNKQKNNPPKQKPPQPTTTSNLGHCSFL